MAKVRHRKQMFGGRYSAEEYHQKWGIPRDAKCVGCGNRPLIRCITMMEVEEAKKLPMINMLMLNDPIKFMNEMIVRIKGSDGRAIPYVRISCVYACKQCRRSLERAAAKAPSHTICEFHYGPGPDKVVSGPS